MSRDNQMLRSLLPWEQAFSDKYRPLAPRGLQLQQPGKGETKSLWVPAKVSADTWCGQPLRWAAMLVRRLAGAERAEEDGSPPDRQTEANGQAGQKL